MSTVGEVIDSAIRSRGLTYAQVGAALGIKRQNVNQWVHYGRLPTVETAAALAELLDAPSIIFAVQTARMVRCEVCGADTLARSLKRRYCSEACGIVARTLGKRAMSETERALYAQANDLRRAVYAMCLACEPDRVCRQAKCPLRPVSPLELAKREVGDIPERDYGWTPERRAKHAQAMRDQWARPGRREQMRQVSRARAVTGVRKMKPPKAA